MITVYLENTLFLIPRFETEKSSLQCNTLVCWFVNALV